jgi:transcriptional regulator with XRE-family HTH domain
MISITVKDSNLLRRLIAESGNTVTSFSEELKISRNYLSAVLSGTRNPSPSLARKIAVRLEVEVSEIFTVHVKKREKQAH